MIGKKLLIFLFLPRKLFWLYEFKKINMERDIVCFSMILLTAFEYWSVMSVKVKGLLPDIQKVRLNEPERFY